MDALQNALAKRATLLGQSVSSAIAGAEIAKNNLASAMVYANEKEIKYLSTCIDQLDQLENDIRGEFLNVLRKVERYQDNDQ